MSLLKQHFTVQEFWSDHRRSHTWSNKHFELLLKIDLPFTYQEKSHFHWSDKLWLSLGDLGNGQLFVKAAVWNLNVWFAKTLCQQLWWFYFVLFCLTFFTTFTGAWWAAFGHNKFCYHNEAGEHKWWRVVWGALWIFLDSSAADPETSKFKGCYLESQGCLI